MFMKHSIPCRRPFAGLVAAIALAALTTPSAASAQVDARMLRQPTVSATQIVFVYGGDLWVMPKNGGTAERLTTARGEESFPKFSPDGKTIAFTANYDGNDEVYTIPANGGDTKRVTYHPGVDRVAAWYPDGKSLLIASGRTSESNRYNKLFKVSSSGGIPEALPMPYGEFASFSPDGKSVAYMPAAVDARTWKRYRGGWAPDFWTFNLETLESKNITNDNANDGQPMWSGNTIYFMSDRGSNQRSNIWAYDTRNGNFHQVTSFNDFDVKYPSAGPTDIVFQAGSRMYLLDIATEKTREVDVKLVTDRASLRPRVENVGNSLTSADISPTGKRALFGARGDVFTVPAEHGAVRNYTQTSGSAERSPTWSPDGKLIGYWSDKTGEYEFTVRNADGTGDERTVTKLGPGFRYAPIWSPDSKKIVFVNQAMQIQMVDVTTGRVTNVDKARNWTHGALVGFTASWSKDSRWIAYSRDLENSQNAIFVYDAKNGGTPQQVTSGYYNDQSPSFDPDGKYLYFLSSRSFDPSYSDFDNSWAYVNSTRIVAVPLRKDVPSPLAPRSDEEVSDSTPGGSGARAGGADANGTTGTAAAADSSKDVRIDFDNFERRVVVLPAAPGNYYGITALSGQLLYTRQTRTGGTFGPTPLMAFDLKDRQEKTIVDNADAFVASADGKKLLVTQGGGWYIIDPRPAQKLTTRLATAGMSVTVDPVAEWRQIFNDAWRIERDYFYDPGMHGVNWNAMRTQYGKLIDDAVTRWDVSFVLGELIGELNASHTYVQGGQYESGPRRAIGLLGADYKVENGYFRIKKIYDGGAWDNEVRSPLLIPGVNVAEGDYLIAVNGRPLDITQDVGAAMDGLAGAVVSLTVNSTPSATNARTVLVTPLGSEGRLRNLAWIESNRKRVEQATNGRVGYVYVPNTGVEGQTELMRQYRAQINKEGMIIDERFNSGGQIPDRFIELLNRPIDSYWRTRDGVPWQTPPIANDGPKVMLMNGWSGSGGDAFPYYFKKNGLGPLIGKRTWGGLIGISGTPAFVDGGSVTAPTFSIYDTDGKWIIEGHGVEPDIEVVDDPTQLAKGVDPQLERAIREVMDAVAKQPKRVAPPDYNKRIPPAR